jgi:hypothetical protein
MNLRSSAMTAFSQLDATTVRSLPGEQLLLFRVCLGRKAARLIDAELDRRATQAAFPGAVVEPAVRETKRSRARRAA